MPQKRKGTADGEHYISKNDQNGDQKTLRPSAVYKPTKGRKHTLSIALPGSIIAKYVSSRLSTERHSTVHTCNHFFTSHDETSTTSTLLIGVVP